MAPSLEGGGGTFSQIIALVCEAGRHSVKEQLDKKINRKALRKSPAPSFPRRRTWGWGWGWGCKDMSECGNLIGYGVEGVYTSQKEALS